MQQHIVEDVKEPRRAFQGSTMLPMWPEACFQVTH